jgi:hypothetical protein
MALPGLTASTLSSSQLKADTMAVPHRPSERQHPVTPCSAPAVQMRMPQVQWEASESPAVVKKRNPDPNSSLLDPLKPGRRRGRRSGKRHRRGCDDPHPYDLKPWRPPVNHQRLPLSPSVWVAPELNATRVRSPSPPSDLAPSPRFDEDVQLWGWDVQRSPPSKSWQPAPRALSSSQHFRHQATSSALPHSQHNQASSSSNNYGR